MPPRGRWITVYLVPCLLLASITLYGVIRSSTRRTGGQLVYALDDAYIHLALARNLATRGTWSVTGDEFQSASSSPLWTSLLACGFAVLGVSTLHALVWNACAVLMVLLVLGLVSARNGGTPYSALLLAAGVFFLSAVPTLVMSGLEHVIQIAVDLAFLHAAVRMVTSREKPGIPGTVHNQFDVTPSPHQRVASRSGTGPFEPEQAISRESKSSFSARPDLDELGDFGCGTSSPEFGAVSDDRGLGLKSPPAVGAWLVLGVLASLVTLSRFEGSFLVGAAAVLFLARGWIGWAVWLLVWGAVPVVAFGLVSTVHGGWFFPNSVVLKALSLGGLPVEGGVKPILQFLTRIPRTLNDAPHLLVLLIACLGAVSTRLRRGAIWSGPGLWSLATIITLLFHLQFAGIGWFYRYEAYLIALGVTSMYLEITSGWTSRRSGSTTELRAELGSSSVGPSGGVRAAIVGRILLGLVMVIPLADRAGHALVETPGGCANIHRQHHQMARFVKGYYGGRAIAANDIGYVALEHNGPLLDLAGLATMSVARARLAGTYSARTMAELADQLDVRLAILYESWFAQGGIPETWKKVGEWTIPERVSASHRTVSFFVTRIEDVSEAIANLKSFARRLPPDVSQGGAYVEAERGPIHQD